MSISILCICVQISERKTTGKCTKHPREEYKNCSPIGKLFFSNWEKIIQKYSLFPLGSRGGYVLIGQTNVLCAGTLRLLNANLIHRTHVF